MTAYVIFDVRTVDREALKPYIEKAFDTLIPYLLLAIQSATFRSCAWGAAWSQILELPRFRGRLRIWAKGG